VIIKIPLKGGRVTEGKKKRRGNNLKMAVINSGLCLTALQKQEEDSALPHWR